MCIIVYSNISKAAATMQNACSTSNNETIHSNPFGMGMPTRSWTASGENYRFGFQSQETDDEIYGNNNEYAFKYRLDDPRLGRFMSIDPLTKNYSWNSPYSFTENKVIQYKDLEGKEIGSSNFTNNPMSVFKWSTGWNSNADAEISHNILNAAKIGLAVSKAVSIVVGGILTTATGGAPVWIVLGVSAAAGGLVRLSFDISGQFERSENTPTTISGDVMVGINYVSEKQVFSNNVIAVAQFTEGVLTLTPKELLSDNDLKVFTEALSTGNFILDASKSGDAKFVI